MTGPSRRRRLVQRDQAESPFALLLASLLEALPFARGAALVDLEGETVDYAGEVDPFELRVAAATFQLLLADLRSTAMFREVRQINVVSTKSGYLVRVLDPHYSLVVVLRKLGTFVVSQRVIDEVETHILLEAGLSNRRAAWHRVDVDAEGRPPRPRRLRRAISEEEPSWTSIEVLGTLVNVGHAEHGYRVRLGTGAEVNLLCENQRLWFIDEPTIAVLTQGSSRDSLTGVSRA